MTRILDSQKSGSESKPDEGTPKPADPKTKENDTVTANQISTTAARSKRQVFLQTATTYAYSPNKYSMVPVRVLMDSGSQRSYVTESFKNKLGLVPEKTEVLNLNTFGDASSENNDVTKFDYSCRVKRRILKSWHFAFQRSVLPCP